ncbi:MAG: hypothetical protein Q8K63_03910 [Acidimicrobiales bacterium]|nr:hypothetical protein [Acidimicrobiales bacterium]
MSTTPHCTRCDSTGEVDAVTLDDVLDALAEIVRDRLQKDEP